MKRLLSAFLVAAFLVSPLSAEASKDKEKTVEAFYLVSKEGTPLEEEAEKLLQDGDYDYVIVVDADKRLVATHTLEDDTLVTARAERKKSYSEEDGEAIELGTVVEAKNFDLQIDSVDFMDVVYPPNTSGYYTYYEAESGKVYIYVQMQVTNKGKSAVRMDDVLSIQAYYSDGYRYTGFSVALDRNNDFTYSNITGIDPLATQFLGYLIEVPEAIATSESEPLYLIIKEGDNQYKYTIR